MNRIQSIFSNPHTSTAGILYGLAKAGAHFGAIWWPQHKDQFDQTAALVESLAVTYGLMLAGDSTKSNEKTAAQAPPKPPVSPVGTAP